MPGRNVFRYVQASVPGLWEAKSGLLNWVMQTTGLLVDPEFRLLDRMGPLGVVLDIGGNYGQSIISFRRHTARAKIISFEPIADLCDKLNARYHGDAGVEIRNVALSDAPGDFTLYIPRYKHAVIHPLASLAKEEVTGWLANPDMFWNYKPEHLTVIENTVRVRTLDSFGLAPDVVKIDVQGLELAVVRGGIETFRKHRPLAIVESPSEAVVALFAEIGMTAYGFDGTRLLSEWRGRNNAVFLSDELKARLGL
jgi:FkbM family methyltransferase